MIRRVCLFFCGQHSKTLHVLEKSLYAQTLYKLVSASYLKPSTILSHLSPRDKAIQYETEEKRKITGFPTAKELRQAQEVAQARLKREEEEAEKVGLVSTVAGKSVLQISYRYPFIHAETQGH
jgi:hypothetical protein